MLNPGIMFRKGFLVCALFFLLFYKANSQSLTVDTYSHELLFNVFKEQPDTAIRSFLRLYIPALSDKKTTAAEASSTVGGKNATRYATEIHSFVFTTHPYFSAAFSRGKLEFSCQRFNDSKGVQVFGVKLWLEFDSQQDAEIAFSKLVDTFMPISTSKRFSSSNGARKAEFTDSKGSKGFNKIQFRLTADNLDHRYFKILFETENDL